MDGAGDGAEKSGSKLEQITTRWALVRLVKAMDFALVMYGCESWTIKKAAAKLLQSCPTPCDPIDGSPPGSAVPGILQARILELVAISFSNA